MDAEGVGRAVTSEEDRTRQLAGKVGAQVRLGDIRLRRIDAELCDPAAEGPYEVGLSVQPTFDEGEGVVVYSVAYRLEATAEGNVTVLRGDIEFSVLYELPPDHGFDENDLAAFGEVSVLFSVHPYIREVVQSLTSRFGLPPLVLDVLRSPLHGSGEGNKADSPEDE